MVLHVGFVVACKARRAGGLTALDVLGLKIAGLCHDVDHPGWNNDYEVQRPSGVGRDHANCSGPRETDRPTERRPKPDAVSSRERSGGLAGQLVVGPRFTLQRRVGLRKPPRGLHVHEVVTTARARLFGEITGGPVSPMPKDGHRGHFGHGHGAPPDARGRDAGLRGPRQRGAEAVAPRLGGRRRGTSPSGELARRS